MYMETRSKVIKIDCDGVLRDLLPKMCELYNSHFKCKIKPENVLEYDLNKTFTKCMEVDGMTPHNWFFNHFGFLVNRRSLVCNGAKEAMKLLHEKGYYIIIVSYQNTHQNKQDTLDWLLCNNIYYDSICFTNKKDLISGDIIVDDNIDFLDMSNETRKVCINAPYNVGKHSYECYDTLYDFVKTLD